MIGQIKQRLAHIDTTTMRYRFAHTATKEARLRKAHACTFYWVYLPAAAIRFLFLPVLEAAAWIISFPIAWLAGFKPAGNGLIFIGEDVEEPDASEVYVNAHRKVAPWRVLLPVVLIAAILMTCVRNGSVGFIVLGIVLGALTVAALIGWMAWQHWANITEVWDRVCPRLEVADPD